MRQAQTDRRFPKGRFDHAEPLPFQIPRRGWVRLDAEQVGPRQSGPNDLSKLANVCAAIDDAIEVHRAQQETQLSVPHPYFREKIQRARGNFERAQGAKTKGA